MFEGKKVVINKALNQKILPPWFGWGQSGDDKVTSHVSTDLQSLKNKLPEGRLKFVRKINLWGDIKVRRGSLVQNRSTKLLKMSLKHFSERI